LDPSDNASVSPFFMPNDQARYRLDAPLEKSLPYHDVINETLNYISDIGVINGYNNIDDFGYSVI